MNDKKNVIIDFEKMYRGQSENKPITCMTIDVAKDYMNPNVGAEWNNGISMDKLRHDSHESKKPNNVVIENDTTPIQQGGYGCQKQRKQSIIKGKRCNRGRFEYDLLIEPKVSQPNKMNHDILLVTCVDKRFVDVVVNYMYKRGLSGLYYQQTINGGSLGALQQWDGFLNVLDHLNKYAKLKHIIVLDHFDCEWYKHYYNNANLYYNAQIPNFHYQNLIKLASMLKKHYPIVEIGYVTGGGKVYMLDSNVTNMGALQ